VNSGRFAEPFWYVDSPLVIPDPSRPFAGRPPRGDTPPAAPGILTPDVPVSLPGATRLRELVRDGFLILTTADTTLSAAAGATVSAKDDAAVSVTDDATVSPTDVATVTATDVPLRVVRIDQEGAIAAALGARAHEAWLIRPDGHVAAILRKPTQETMTAALHRALGNDLPPRREPHPMRSSGGSSKPGGELPR
jgi:3-(3-hydroxy-phenyl)propionate hydroxylase